MRIRCAELLVLALSAIAFRCSDKKNEHTISIVWEDQKAIGVVVPVHFFRGVPSDSIADALHVRLVNQKEQLLFGSCSVENDVVYFKPVVPFTKGLTYEVLVGKQPIDTLLIEDSDKADPPKLLAIYPSADSLPENVLKLYLEFSSPMQEGESLNHIALIEDNRDTLQNTFLDLKPELWNSEGTLLTLWLDPGRIKRDLQPNRALGSPLKKNKNYTLVVSRNWRNTEGKTLTSDFTKHFFVATRDESIPDIDRWKITEPKVGTTRPLAVDFSEPLDYSLITEAVKILDREGKLRSGKFEATDRERGFLFTPDSNWEKGEYQIAVEARLEDLAGNNLNRPFDRDLKKSDRKIQKEIFTKRFKVN